MAGPRSAGVYENSGILNQVSTVGPESVDKPNQPLGELKDHLPEKVVLVAVELLAQPLERVHRVVDHRVLPLVVFVRDSKRLTRWSSRPADLRPLHHY